MIHNISNLIKKNKFKKQTIEFINKSLKDGIIPQLLSKYPKSEDSEVNIKFNNLVRNYDNIENHENDFVYTSGVKF